MCNYTVHALSVQHVEMHVQDLMRADSFPEVGAALSGLEKLFSLTRTKTKLSPLQALLGAFILDS